MANSIEEIITTLYEMVQDAWSLPLGAEKCVLERDKVLDLLDEISNQLPGELKQAKTIVQSRDELVAQARREAENMIRSARAQADELVKQENIYQEARRQCELMVQETQNRITQLKTVSNDYVDNSLAQTEEAILKSLNELRETRARFQALSGMNQPQAPVQPQQPANYASFDQDID